MSIHIQVQLAGCQQVLIVQLHEFENIYNAEVIEGRGFCCCDKKTKDKNCKQQLKDLPDCPAKCDTWFSIYLSPCQSPLLCSTSTLSTCEGTSVLSLEYTYEFVICSSQDTVSVNTCTQSLSSNRIPVHMHACM